MSVRGQQTKPANKAHRRTTFWLAAMIHRISGLALAAFLPLHFLFLGLAIEGEARLNEAVAWTQNPLVKFAEGGLIFLVVVHLLGGLRVLAIENLPWRDNQKTLALVAAGLAVVAAMVFLARAL